MNGSSMYSLGPSSKYTVLSNNVSIILSKLDPGNISQAERRLMERAADLLKNIVQGSKFVERKDAGALSNPSENLFTVGHAIQALQFIAADQQLKHITKTFGDFERDLRRLSRAEDVGKVRIQAIAQFFDALGRLFFEDVARSASPRRQALFEHPKR